MAGKRPKPIPQSKPTDMQKPTAIVGVGASAGGLEAFEQLLAALPLDSGMAFVLIQHLAPKHESLLSALLGKKTRMPVVDVQEGVHVRPDHVYVIPPNADLTIADGALHLAALPEERTHRMPIDHFFRSLAEDQHGRAIGVILSGTATDGTLGLQAIKANGGITFAQDEGSAKYSGMPRSAVAAGNIDFILPPDLIAREITRIAKHAYVLASDDGAGGAHESDASDEPFNKILGLLRNFSRVDFNYYKHGTTKRRIARRMLLRKIDNLTEYHKYLRKHPEELEALFNDVLINVTSFFRDPEAFDVLCKAAFQSITEKPGNSHIRIWVTACATGEEAYSIAIALLEYLGKRANDFRIQIFATDVSESIIQKARAGIFPDSISMDVSQERLRRFFQKMDGSYQISKTIRDMCLFAKQDIAKDPPFSKLDLISCRNVMIYMGPVLQKRIFPLFHYALNPGGVLFLGSAETIGGFGEMFAVLDKKHRIYTRKGTSAPIHFEYIQRAEPKEEQPPDFEPPSKTPNLERIADQILLTRYAPAALVVNGGLDIVHFVGQTGPFLEPAPGNASLNLWKMVKSGLHVELRLAFQKMKQNGSIRREGVLVENDGGYKSVNLEIVRLRNGPAKERHYLIAFEDAGRKEKTGADSKEIKESVPKGKNKQEMKTKKKIGSEEQTRQHTRLKEELDATREYLQSIIEEQRTTNEELRSANEEIQSSNEELQSINEELETAKEELQSTNEELTTVNEELQNRNEELTRLNDDLNNLLGSVNIAIVMLGNDLRVRRFTPMAEGVMNLIPTDVGRPFTDLKPNLKLPDLRQTVSRVMETLETVELEVEDQSGKWYALKIRPYRTLDNRIDGVVIVLLDLDTRLRPAKRK